MSSRQLSNYPLDRLEATLSRFYLQESSISTAVNCNSFGSYGSSGSSAAHHHQYKLVATETKVVQETTHREVVLESSYGGNCQDSDGGDSDAGERDSCDDDGPGEVCYEVPSVEVVGHSESFSHQYAEEEYNCEEQGSLERYGYDGGCELESYGGQSDYGGYYSQDSYDDYY